MYCLNDLMAIGALQACREAGVRVPSELALAGFDDIEEARFTVPPLTTITPDLGFLTREALRILLGRIDGSFGDSPAENVEVPWRLTVRESTAG